MIAGDTLVASVSPSHADLARPAKGGSSARRVLIVHNRYQVRGGEDAVVERETAALAAAGLQVSTLIVTNDAIRSPLDRVRAAVQAVRAPAGIEAVLTAARRCRPDVVHVHNTFPLISPAALGAVRATGAATVQTLHNYRIACAGGQFMRDGAPCETCVTGSPYNGVRHGCYRGSRVGTLAVAHMIATHRRSGTWGRDVDRFIALTAFAKGRFVAAGVPASRIVVRPNGVADPGPHVMGPRRGILFVGRLSPEKGVRTLADAAPHTRASISAIGEGPLRAELAERGSFDLRGAQGRSGVSAAMGSAAAVVVPSLWYEGLPMVVAEAFAAGTPVIASKIGALAELIEDGVTGVHVRPGHAGDLAQACDWIEDHPAEAARMGQAARARFLRDWSEDVTTASLLAIYAEAMACRNLEGVSDGA